MLPGVSLQRGGCALNWVCSVGVAAPSWFSIGAAEAAPGQGSAMRGNALVFRLLTWPSLRCGGRGTLSDGRENRGRPCQRFIQQVCSVGVADSCSMGGWQSIALLPVVVWFAAACPMKSAAWGLWYFYVVVALTAGSATFAMVVVFTSLLPGCRILHLMPDSRHYCYYYCRLALASYVKVEGTPNHGVSSRA